MYLSGVVTTISSVNRWRFGGRASRSLCAEISPATWFRSAARPTPRRTIQMSSCALMSRARRATRGQRWSSPSTGSSRHARAH